MWRLLPNALYTGQACLPADWPRPGSLRKSMGVRKERERLLKF